MKRFYTRYDYWLTLTGCLTAASIPYYVLWRYGYETNLDAERVAKFVLAALGGVLVGMALALAYQLALSAAKTAPAWVALGTALGVAVGTVAVVENATPNEASMLSTPASAPTPPPPHPEPASDDSVPASKSEAYAAPHSLSPVTPAPPTTKLREKQPVLTEEKIENGQKNETSGAEPPASTVSTSEKTSVPSPESPGDAALTQEKALRTPGDERAVTEHVALGYLGYPIFIYFNRPETVEIIEKNFVTYDSQPVNGEFKYGENEKVFFIGDQKHVHVDLSFIKSRLESAPDIVHYSTVAFDKWVVVKAIRQGIFEGSSGYADVPGSEAGKLEGYVLEYLVFKKNTATGEGTHLLKIYCPRVYKKLSNAKRQMDFRVVPK